MATARFKAELEKAKFFGKIRRKGNVQRPHQEKYSDRCYTWTGSHSTCPLGVKKLEYPRIRSKGRLFGVHRILWEATNGPLPLGKYLTNVCGNRLCIRPSHWEVK